MKIEKDHEILLQHRHANMSNELQEAHNSLREDNSILLSRTNAMMWF